MFLETTTKKKINGLDNVNLYPTETIYVINAEIHIQNSKETSWLFIYISLFCKTFPQLMTKLSFLANL